MILIAYDGSADAQAAIDQAAELFKRETVTVLTVWEPLADVLARSGAGFGLAPEVVDFERIDKATEQAAVQRAKEGAERARAAGLDATAETAVLDTTAAAGIIAAAKQHSARAIVMGSRGLTGIKSLVLGSVSHAVLHHADRPVVVVPSPAVAKERTASLH